jgi:hypothetical protein
VAADKDRMTQLKTPSVGLTQLKSGKVKKRYGFLTFSLAGLLNLVASIHLVWFYLSYTPSYLHLEQFEVGLERTPFQYRLLMMLPLRWAHRSPSLNHLAASLSALHAWFPKGVRPEGLIEAPVDLVSVIITGLVARSLYRASSRTTVLLPFVYPLTLVMILSTYAITTMHHLRFIYDLPSMALFSIGLYLLYFRKSELLFISLFVVATVSRETTFFLLFLLFLSRIVPVETSWDGLFSSVLWSGALKRSTWGTAILLTGFWITWHIYVGRLFAGNVSEMQPRFWLNVGILLWPISWSQISSTFAFCWPIILLHRRDVRDRTLRAWQWILPVWILFMMRYGILIESRIFGELIPYMACMAALIAEEYILKFSFESRPYAILRSCC